MSLLLSEKCRKRRGPPRSYNRARQREATSTTRSCIHPQTCACVFVPFSDFFHTYLYQIQFNAHPNSPRFQRTHYISTTPIPLFLRLQFRFIRLIMSSTQEELENTKQQKKQKEFDAEAGSNLVKELRETFATGKTRNYEWRVSQLNALLKLAQDHEQQIIDALRNDLDKPPLETVAYEVQNKTALIFNVFNFNLFLQRALLLWCHGDCKI